MRKLLTILALATLGQAQAAMQATPVEWTLGDIRFAGVLVYDDASAAKRPGLVMIPNWMGVGESAVERAKDVAGDRYVVLVADVYGADVRPQNVNEAQAATRAAYADRAELRRRASKALDVLKAQVDPVPLDTGKLGAIGFCFGGATALELARSGAELAGVVSLHGGLATSAPAAAGEVKASILVLNGASDAGVTDEHIQAFQKEMDTAGVDWQFVNYAGAVHCFAEPDANRPPNCLYHERSAKRAYRALHDFFAERFGG